MERKQRLNFEIKELTADGSFEGMLSPYGVVDEGGDVVERGAFSKTIKEHGDKVPLLWQHQAARPIGELTLEDRSDGLWCKGQLLMTLGDAQRAYLLIKAKIVKGLSIGFKSVKDSIDAGVRHLKEVRLYEGSLVTFPMAESALIFAVKGHEEKGDFNETISCIQMCDAGWQIRRALMCALDSAMWSGLTRDEIIKASETTIQQFSDAYLAWLPAYLDMLATEDGGMSTMSMKLLETKSGRMISAANKETIQTACDHMENAAKVLKALLADEAGDGTKAVPTSEGEAAAETKSEPEVVDHSAVLSQIETMKGVFQSWNLSSSN